MDLLPKLIFWESQMTPSYSFKFADEEKDSSALCTSFAHLLHAHLRTNAQCGFSTAHRIFHSIFRSKSSSVRDWLSAKRMAKTPPPFALQICSAWSSSFDLSVTLESLSSPSSWK